MGIFERMKSFFRFGAKKEDGHEVARQEREAAATVAAAASGEQGAEGVAKAQPGDARLEWQRRSQRERQCGAENAAGRWLSFHDWYLLWRQGMSLVYIAKASPSIAKALAQLA